MTNKSKRPGLSRDQLAQVGSTIPGSSLFRDFCIECGEAIRVVDAGKPNTCLDCSRLDAQARAVERRIEAISNITADALILASGDKYFRS